MHDVVVLEDEGSGRDDELVLVQSRVPEQLDAGRDTALALRQRHHLGRAARGDPYERGRPSRR